MPDVTDPELSILVQSDRLQLLYRQSYPAVFVSILAGAILTATLWPAQNHRTLLVWFGLLTLTAVARLYLFYEYRMLAPRGEDMLAWETPYFITLMLTSATWGIGGLYIMPQDSVLHQAIVFSYMVALAGGATSLYSSHCMMTLSTIAVILIPVTVYFFFVGEYVYVGMATAAVLFFLTCMRATRFISRTFQQNFKMTRELKLAKERAEQLARIDDLTGIYNRRAFYEYGNVLINACRRARESISLIHMDIDHFKRINDTYGHDAGDMLLKQLSRLLTNRLRKSDVFARLGGEEFGILLPNTTKEQAAVLAEELRREIADADFGTGSDGIHLTASLGVATGSYDIDTLLSHSDRAMYKSKQAGRNRTSMYETEAA